MLNSQRDATTPHVQFERTVAAAYREVDHGSGSEVGRVSASVFENKIEGSTSRCTQPFCTRTDCGLQSCVLRGNESCEPCVQADECCPARDERSQPVTAVPLLSRIFPTTLVVEYPGLHPPEVVLDDQPEPSGKFVSLSRARHRGL